MIRQNERWYKYAVICLSITVNSVFGLNLSDWELHIYLFQRESNLHKM